VREESISDINNVQFDSTETRGGEEQEVGGRVQGGRLQRQREDHAGADDQNI